MISSVCALPSKVTGYRDMAAEANNPTPPPLQLRTSEIFATVESTGPVVPDLYLQILLGGNITASRQTAALRWVQPVDLPFLRLLALP